MAESFGADTALIVVDVQNDFCPGGALAVPDGDAVVQPINQLIKRFETVILTQDWHPPGHLSFHTSHAGQVPFGTVQLPYGLQTLWPEHCVQGTTGAEFHPALAWTKAQLVVRKGFHRPIDSYSAFYENDRTTPTGLAGYLRERGVGRVVLAGLATDFCVRFSALDAATHGLKVSVVMDACRAIDLNGSLGQSEEQMREAGVTLTTTAALT